MEINGKVIDEAAYLEALFAAHPGWREDHERRSQPTEHEFVLDPGSLPGSPWCLSYDEHGRQCDHYPAAHPGAMSDA